MSLAAETVHLLDAVGPGGVARLAVLGPPDRVLLAAAAARWGCDILLVATDRSGAFTDAAIVQAAATCRDLEEAGVAAARLQVARSPTDLRPADLILNLAAYGDRWKAGPLATLLPPLLQNGARMLGDIRKGSGTFPLLKPLGQTTALSEITDGEKPVTRVLFVSTTAAQPADAPAPQDDGWSAIAAGLAGNDGFFCDSPDHSFLFIPRGDTLVVTFDNLDIAMTKREDRRPWGFSFIEKQGWSMLGVMANGWTWYRDPWVWAEFDRLRDSGFFTRFRRVVFYGASMGGYAAAAFVAACPGADVVAISPQSTLDKRLVPWETRYHTAWGRDFSGPYGDAAEVSRAAGRVFLLYDPYERLDSGHATRFTGPNVTALRAPLMGHRLGSSLQQMGLLAPITLAALNGTLTEAEFYRSLRARKGFARYQKELFRRALDRGRPDLARRLGRWVLTRGENRYIRQRMLDL